MKLSATNFGIEKIGKTYLETIDLLEKTGFVQQQFSGSFVYLHLMQKTLAKLLVLIRKTIEDNNCLEIGLTQLQSADLWKKTGRYETYGEEMYKLSDRKDKEFILAGTNEELVTSVAATKIKSYKDLNFTWYQINNKFRDEIRAYGGLIRGKEFSMLDGYSFHDTKENLCNQYDTMRTVISDILRKLNLDFKIEKAESGEIGGSMSEEFIVNGIEVAHIFQLDDKYSKVFNCTYMDNMNQTQYVLMGCYGIGITRLLQVIADTKRKENFLNWGSISAYEYAIVVANSADTTQMEVANSLYYKLKKQADVYLDDRNLMLGEKLHQVDRIGAKTKIIVGKKAYNGLCEVKKEDVWIEMDIMNM